MSTAVLIRGVRLYGEGDPVDVLVADGQIAQIGSGLKVPAGGDLIEAGGQVLLPGLVDLHTHLREPGREYAEDIESGSAAAALDRKSTRLNSSHIQKSRMPSSA